MIAGTARVSVLKGSEPSLTVRICSLFPQTMACVYVKLIRGKRKIVISY